MRWVSFNGTSRAGSNQFVTNLCYDSSSIRICNCKCRKPLVSCWLVIPAVKDKGSGTHDLNIFRRSSWCYVAQQRRTRMREDLFESLKRLVSNAENHMPLSLSGKKVMGKNLRCCKRVWKSLTLISSRWHDWRPPGSRRSRADSGYQYGRGRRTCLIVGRLYF